MSSERVRLVLAVVVTALVVAGLCLYHHADTHAKLEAQEAPKAAEHQHHGWEVTGLDEAYDAEEGMDELDGHQHHDHGGE